MDHSSVPENTGHLPDSAPATGSHAAPGTESQPTTATATTPVQSHRGTLIDSVRRVLHTSVFFLIIFLFLRIVALEPFGVPTGSMAPTLFGNHREFPCPNCGYRLIVGDVTGDRNPRLLRDATCPNCQHERIDYADSPHVPGDRLLVDKMVFSLRQPRRWEMAVFRCPVDDTKPYVKRVIGLPGEGLQLVGGDVFASDVLIRKTLAQVREMLVPVFDMRFPPRGGWFHRWQIEPVAGEPGIQRSPTVAPRPVDASQLKDTALFLNTESSSADSQTPEVPALALTYRHVHADDMTEEIIGDGLTYNGPVRRSRGEPVHDFILICDLEVIRGKGSFACRLGDGRDSVKVEIPIGSPASIRLSQDDGDAFSTGQFPLLPGKTYRLEFAFVDRRAMFAVDGKEVVSPIDLPTDIRTHAERRGVSRPLQMGARGVNVAIRNLRLLRDIHYRAEGTHATVAPFRLGESDYFMLGDNPANSHDSREWAIPGVPERDFIGKPFLIHQPLKPGRMSLGGQERVFQTVDWSRLRWVR